MIFAKRDVEQVSLAGIECKTFFLNTRTHPFLLVKDTIRLKNVLKSFKPDIIHAHYGTMTAIVTEIAAARTPVIVTFHGAELQTVLGVSMIRQKAGHILSQLAAFRASRVVCVSEKVRSRLWCSKSKVHVIPSSVNLKLFFPQCRKSAREALGWDPEKSVVLFYQGRNPLAKRLDLALHTVEMTREAYGPIAFQIIGTSIEPDTIPLYLNAADCLLFTSDSEGSPTIVKEAMACNLPIVSVDVGDVRSRLEGVTNCFIRKDNPADLSNALVSVLQSRERSNGRMHIGDVTSQVSRDRLIEMYRATLGRRRFI